MFLSFFHDVASIFSNFKLFVLFCFLATRDYFTQVFASFEMYMTLRVENFRHRYSNTRNTAITSVLLGLILLLSNFPNKILYDEKLKNELMAFSDTNSNKTARGVFCVDIKIDDELLSYLTKVNFIKFDLIYFLCYYYSFSRNIKGY